MIDRWLEARIAGPAAGMCSSPITEAWARSRRNGPATSLDSRYCTRPPASACARNAGHPAGACHRLARNVRCGGTGRPGTAPDFGWEHPEARTKMTGRHGLGAVPQDRTGHTVRAAATLAELKPLDLDDLDTVIAELAVGELILVVADYHTRFQS